MSHRWEYELGAVAGLSAVASAVYFIFDSTIFGTIFALFALMGAVLAYLAWPEA